MKILISITIALLMLVFGVFFGYKLAIKDSAALGLYIEMGNAYAHLKVLDNKGADGLRKFLIRDIPLTTSLHRTFVENQSFLSRHLGPENENVVLTNRKEYYEGIKEYYQSLSNTEENQFILRDLEWLLENLEQ